MSPSTDRRNPYLVLGVDYGAEHDEVTAAYTRRSRLARADNGYPYTIDDLVWALDEIEALNSAGASGAGGGAASAAVTFRVPADPKVYRPPEGPGLLRPEPVPLRRRTRPAPRTEIAGLVASARRDATAYALERLADQVEQTLVAPAGRIRLSVPDPPRQPRSRGPLLAVFSGVALAVVAAVLFVVGQSDDQPTLEATVAPTTTEFVVITTPPAEGFQTPIVANELQIMPTDPVSYLGVTCVLWQLSGPPPLTFDPAMAELDVGGTVFRDDPAIRFRTDLPALDPASPTGTAETCFPVMDAAPTSTQVELRYTPPGTEGVTPYRWLVTMP